MTSTVKKIIAQVIAHGISIEPEGWTLHRHYPTSEQQSHGACNWSLIHDTCTGPTLMGFGLARDCAKECEITQAGPGFHNAFDIMPVGY